MATRIATIGSIKRAADAGLREQHHALRTPDDRRSSPPARTSAAQRGYFAMPAYKFCGAANSPHSGASALAIATAACRQRPAPPQSAIISATKT
jgi:hypothetical protein